VTEIIFAVLFVSLMGLTRCYKTTVFLHLYSSSNQQLAPIQSSGVFISASLPIPEKC